MADDKVQYWLDTIQQSAQARGLPYTYAPQPLHVEPETPGLIEGLATKAPDLLGTNAGIIASPQAAEPITALASRALPAPQAAQAISTAADPRYDQPFGPPTSDADPVAIAAANAPNAAQSQPQAPPPDANGVVPPATYVPAHFDDSRIPTTEQTRNDILQTYDAQADAQKNLALSQAMQSRVTADAMAQEAERANQSLANQQAKEDDRQQFVKSRLAQLDSMTDDFAKQSVNPHQWWDNANMFQKAMAGISIALGGGVAAVRGGSNMGADMINTAIQQNIDAQKANIDLKRIGLQQKGNLLEQYRQAFGDDRMGDLAMEQALRQNAMDKITADAADQGPQIMAGAQNAVAQLKRQQDLQKAEFERLAYVRAHMTGGPQALQKTDPSLLVKLPNGENIQAPTKDEATEMRAKAGMLQNLKDNINQILAIRRDAGPLDLKNPMSNAHRTIMALVNDSKINMAQFNSGGKRMNEADVQSAMDQLDAATDISGSPDKVLTDVRNNFDRHFTNEARALGSEQVDRGYRINAQGQLEPGTAYKGASDTPRTGQAAPSSFKPTGQ